MGHWISDYTDFFSGVVAYGDDDFKVKRRRTKAKCKPSFVIFRQDYFCHTTVPVFSYVFRACLLIHTYNPWYTCGSSFLDMIGSGAHQLFFTIMDRAHTLNIMCLKCLHTQSCSHFPHCQSHMLGSLAHTQRLNL